MLTTFTHFYMGLYLLVSLARLAGLVLVLEIRRYKKGSGV